MYTPGDVAERPLYGEGALFKLFAVNAGLLCEKRKIGKCAEV